MLHAAVQQLVADAISTYLTPPLLHSTALNNAISLTFSPTEPASLWLCACTSKEEHSLFAVGVEEHYR